MFFIIKTNTAAVAQPETAAANKAVDDSLMKKWKKITVVLLAAAAFAAVFSVGVSALQGGSFQLLKGG